MTLGPLALRFLDLEVTAHDRDLMLLAARERTQGIEHFSFNIFNVLIDVDRNVVTIEDDLDADSEEEVSMDEFLTTLTSMHFK
jgi:hypothetical protein